MVEVGKSKKEKLFSKILLALLLIVLVSLFSITFAWFTDKKEYEGTLNFGSIELDVSGGVDNETQTLTFDVSRVSGPTYTGKLMPGDTVNINLTLGLKSTSEPAYYIVYIFDNNGVFEESMYFSEDGTNVYVNNFTKTYLQTDANKASVSGKYCGKLTNESAQNITISAKVSEDYENQGTNVKVFCKIYAIQQANLTSQQAYDELYPRVNFVATWKSDLVSAGVGISDATKLTKLSFETSSSVDSNVYQDTTKTLGTTGIKIYQNKTVSTDIAFVSDKVIMAPENCLYLFSDSTEANRLTNLTSITFNNFNTSSVTNINSMFAYCSKLTSLDLSNFNTSSVTNINSMFAYCSKLTSLDVSSFTTSKVTIMNYMFNGCSELTSLNVSSFNTSSVTSMSNMFYNCSALTSLDVSSFNTSSVTNMYAMFYGCSGLTSLEVSNFNTSKVTSMAYMFKGCSGLTSLDLSSFTTSEVTNMSYMFRDCSSLTSLDLSNFTTGKVTSMEYMFSGTFSNAPSSSTLNISSNFTYKVGGVNTQFASKAELNTQTYLNTSVSVLKDGVALS